MRSFAPLLFMAAAAVASAQVHNFAGCAVFPANNVWNTRIDTLPVDRNSAAYIASANATNTKLHPDFGYGTVLTGGMPYNVVSGSQAKTPISFYYSGDPGPYPIPSDINIQGGSDHHAMLIDNTNCIAYEIFNLQKQTNGSWLAGSGMIFPLNSNAMHPAGLTSADAAGLPILPGMITYDEVMSGQITHALRLTIDHTRNQYIWPARHSASYLTGTQYAPMGQRFRLKAGYNINQFSSPKIRVILQALKTYGLILADNGTSWHLTGVGDLRWNDDEMHALTQVTGDNFEAIDESSLIVDPNSAQAKTSNASPIPTGWVNVISKNSGKCLDIVGGPAATQQTTPVQQYTCVGSQQTNQHFQFVPVTGGYKIIARNSGLALQLSSGTGSVNGTPIETWPFESQSYQTWKLVVQSNGAYTVTNNSSNSCLDVRGISKLNNALVQQWACGNGQANQQWTFTPVQ